MTTRATRRWRVPPRGNVVAGWATFMALSCATVALSSVASYTVRACTALATAGLLLHGARRRDGLRRSRRLLAAGLLVGAASGIGAAIHVLVVGRSAQASSWIDWLELSYVPMVVAGFLSIPATPGGRVRTAADATVAAGAFWYVAQVLVIAPQQLGEGLSTWGRLATICFVLLPTFVVAVLLSTLSRVVDGARPFLVRAAVGMSLLAFSDISFSITTWKTGYDPAGWIPVVHQAGLTFLLGAAVVAGRARAHLAPTAPGGKERAFETLLPYLAVVAPSASPSSATWPAAASPAGSRSRCW